MDGNPWFPVEDPQEDGEEPWDFDAAELAFVEALQNRAVSWRVPFAHSDVGRPDDDSSLLVYVSLSDREQSLTLEERAVHFHGAHVRAGKVCDQLFHLHETAERGFFRASGTPEQLGERCAARFETVLSRPVIRMEWRNLQASTYATSWTFADDAEHLAGNAEPDLGPVADTGRRASRVRHDRCVLVRGASQPQEGPHTPLRPYYAPEPTG